MKTWVTEGGIEITRILFGRSNAFLVSNGHSTILVDTGWSGDRRRLGKLLNRTGRPGMVIMTHTHFDHAGNAGMLKEKFDPLFVVQESEKKFLESGDSPVPKGTVGWTRMIYRLGAERVPHWFHVPGVQADVVFPERCELQGFGDNSYILHTPGHSAGSSSVVIGNEIAMVGDTVDGMPASVFPPWGDDPAGIIRSWKKLLDTGCRIFHPAHGFPVSRVRLEREFLKRIGRIVYP